LGCGHQKVHLETVFRGVQRTLSSLPRKLPATAMGACRGTGVF
jgi:hypothetical protein